MKICFGGKIWGAGTLGSYRLLLVSTIPVFRFAGGFAWFGKVGFNHDMRWVRVRILFGSGTLGSTRVNPLSFDGFFGCSVI